MHHWYINQVTLGRICSMRVPFSVIELYIVTFSNYSWLYARGTTTVGAPRDHTGCQELNLCWPYRKHSLSFALFAYRISPVFECEDQGCDLIVKRPYHCQKNKWLSKNLITIVKHLLQWADYITPLYLSCWIFFCLFPPTPSCWVFFPLYVRVKIWNAGPE